MLSSLHIMYQLCSSVEFIVFVYMNADLGSLFTEMSLQILICLSLVLQKESPSGQPTQSAHPARFSPDDKFSKHRVICKKRFNLLPTQQPPHNY